VSEKFAFVLALTGDVAVEFGTQIRPKPVFAVDRRSGTKVFDVARISGA